jgi:two-component system phosphate regulon response regulator PhoB
MTNSAEILLTSGGDEHLGLIANAFGDLSAQVLNVADLLAWQSDGAPWLFVDWLLPLMSGLQLLRLIRARPWGSRATITMILPSSDEALQARAMEAGADDYLIGPMTPDALVDRVRTCRSLIGIDDQQPLAIGRLKIDQKAYCARYDGELILLSLNEFRLLAFFVRHPNKVFSRDDLIGVLGKTKGVNHQRTVDVWMSRLRGALENHRVPYLPRTVRSFGYILDHDLGRQVA